MSELGQRYVQKWHWDHSITTRVRNEFQEKVKLRLNVSVSNFKKKWLKKGDSAPDDISLRAWQHLVRYWVDPHSQQVSVQYSASRNYVTTKGYGPPKNTSGRIPFGFFSRLTQVSFRRL